MEAFKEFLVPSNGCVVLAALGGLGIVVPSLRRCAPWLLSTAMLLLLVLSSGWTATALLSPLERAYPAMLQRDGQPAAAAVVVLGAYGVADSELPISSWPNDAALFRVVEAAHLRARCGACLLFVTGSSPTVDVMAQVLVSLGVPEAALVIDGNANTTVDSARNLEARLRGAQFLLVTSAGHMPRAMLAFRAQGLAPLPAPTDFRSPRSLGAANPWPTPHNLQLSDLAVREHLGLLWYRAQGM